MIFCKARFVIRKSSHQKHGFYMANWIFRLPTNSNRNWFICFMAFALLEHRTNIVSFSEIQIESREKKPSKNCKEPIEQISFTCCHLYTSQQCTLCQCHIVYIVTEKIRIFFFFLFFHMIWFSIHLFGWRIHMKTYVSLRFIVRSQFDAWIPGKKRLPWTCLIQLFYALSFFHSILYMW